MAAPQTKFSVVVLTVAFCLVTYTSLVQAGDIKAKKAWDAKGHGDHITAVCFSPDGKTIASGADGQDNKLLIWNRYDGKLLKALKCLSWQTVFSPSGKILAGGGLDKIVLWDVGTGNALRTISLGNNFSLRSLAFSPDEKMIAAGGLAKSIKLFNIATGKQMNAFNLNRGYCWNIAFSPDGRILAAGGNPDIQLYETSTGNTARVIKPYPESKSMDPNKDTLTMAFTLDGRFLITAGLEKTVRMWNVAEGSLFKAFPVLRCGISTIAVNPDGKTIASSICDDIGLIDVASGKMVKTIAGDIGFITSMAFSPDGNALAVGGRGEIVRMYQLEIQ